MEGAVSALLSLSDDDAVLTSETTYALLTLNNFL